MGEQVCAHTEDAPLLGLRFPAGLLDKLGRPRSGCHSVHGDPKVAPVTPPSQSLGPAKLVAHRLGHDIVHVTDVGQKFLGPLLLEELQSTALGHIQAIVAGRRTEFGRNPAGATGEGWLVREIISLNLLMPKDLASGLQNLDATSSRRCSMKNLCGPCVFAREQAV